MTSAHKFLRFQIAITLSFCLLLFSLQAMSGTPFVVIASTTSTENSGLYDHLLPHFTEETGIEVRVIAVGTGQALRVARNGDADVLLVHHRPSEEQFVADGFGIRRYDLMYNDYVVVGAGSDPASTQTATDVADALTRIADHRSLFFSRGDDSGTHKKELELWARTDIKVADSNGEWYRETGRGMGATLNMASSMDAYTLSDRSTWLSFGNKGNLALLFQGDPPMFNQYGIILVNPKKHPHARAEEGQVFIDWMLGEVGQNLINSFQIQGQQAFFANAAR
ncbi:MAG TPA: substrate-binding domain-containing protein [Arenicellales bacterium]|nr:substrate-binding domain-containing protein [Arenicellales bacterium]MDP7220257.1 substrate-binding domain-containing protein [Arenicellales bacterium]HJP10751.1 substrate-binding domain-containing protein [Arenicellales bacterium]